MDKRDAGKLAKTVNRLIVCMMKKIKATKDFQINLLEGLSYDFSYQIHSRFHELIWEATRREFYDQDELNQIYKEWLTKYHNDDDLIMEKELEKRYGAQVKKRFRNVGKNMKMRTKVEYERYYNLPAPLNRVDWRNPYDNIFIWDEKGKRIRTIMNFYF
jgi:hypothetical protein